MRTRKFFYGDTAVVNSNEKCTNHNGHLGKILMTSITRVPIGTRVVYRFGCECGATLSLRSANMDLIDDPFIGNLDALPISVIEWTEAVVKELTDMRKKYINSTYGSLDILDARQRDIVLKRRGEGGEQWTLDKLSRHYGLSRQRIWAIERAAVKKLVKQNSNGQT